MAPYLALIDEHSPQRRHSLREVFNALRWLARSGSPWCMMAHDFPPWAAVYQQLRRWVVERSFGWLARFRRLSRDLEGLPKILAGLHFVVFAMLMLPKAVMCWAVGSS